MKLLYYCKCGDIRTFEAETDWDLVASELESITGEKLEEQINKLVVV